MRMILSLVILTSAIGLVTLAEAQPGRGSGAGPDLQKLETEIQKMKAALEDAESRLKAARDLARRAGEFGKGDDKGKGEKGEKSKDDKGKAKDDKGKDDKGKGKDDKGKDDKGFGGFPMPGGGFGWGRGGFGGIGGFPGFDKGKTPEPTKAAPAPASESDRILAELKKIIAAAEKMDDKKAPESPRGFGPRETAPKTAPTAPAASDVERRLQKLEASLEEIRALLRRR